MATFKNINIGCLASGVLNMRKTVSILLLLYILTAIRDTFSGDFPPQIKLEVISIFPDIHKSFYSNS